MASANSPENKTGRMENPPVKEVKTPYTLPLKSLSVSSCNIVLVGTLINEFDKPKIKSRNTIGYIIP